MSFAKMKLLYQVPIRIFFFVLVFLRVSRQPPKQGEMMTHS